MDEEKDRGEVHLDGDDKPTATAPSNKEITNNGTQNDNEELHEGGMNAAATVPPKEASDEQVRLFIYTCTIPLLHM